MTEQTIAVFTLTLPLPEINTILTALGELPAKTSYPIIHGIHQQMQPQLQVSLPFVGCANECPPEPEPPLLSDEHRADINESDLPRNGIIE